MDFFLRNIEDYDAVTGMSVWKGEDCGEKVLPSITRVWWVCRVAAHLELYLTFSKQVSIFQQILIVCGQFGRKNSGVIFFCHFPITSWRLPWHNDPLGGFRIWRPQWVGEGGPQKADKRNKISWFVTVTMWAGQGWGSSFSKGTKFLFWGTF